jgi:1,4-dihydroxy-2-naphthoate octaprenyltransferase
MTMPEDRQSGIPGRWQVVRSWYRASRPFTLSAALAPVLVGSALAFREGRANLGILILVLLASALVQVTANLVDEYSDHARPEGRNKLLAPHKVIAMGVLSSQAVKRGAFLCAGTAVTIGAYLVAITEWPLLIVCLLSLTVAYFYSAGPRPLGNIGLGHPLVFFFMGPVIVMGSYYVQSHLITWDAVWLSISVGCSVTAILVANDLRDLEEDRASGKTTLVTLWGRSFGRWEWTLLVIIAFLIPVALVASGTYDLFVLLPLLALPQGVIAALAIWRGRKREDFLRALQLTSRLHGYLGLLLAVGLGSGYFRLLSP